MQLQFEIKMCKKCEMVDTYAVTSSLSKDTTGEQ